MIFPFVLKFNDGVAQDFEKLPKHISARIWAKLQTAKLNPFQYFFRIKGRSDYKLRIGDYRVIADIKLDERAIEITKVGHRRNIYK